MKECKKTDAAARKELDEFLANMPSKEELYRLPLAELRKIALSAVLLLTDEEAAQVFNSVLTKSR